MIMFGKKQLRSILALLFASSIVAGCFGNRPSQEDMDEEVTQDSEAADDSGASTETQSAGVTQDAAAMSEETPPVADAAAAASSPETSSPASATTQPTETATSAQPNMAINTSKRVLYVKVDGASMREQPDSKAKIVGKLSRGEHFLVSIEGDWAKTEDGKYIAMSALSEKGIARKKHKAKWHSPASKEGSKDAASDKSGE